MTDQPATTPAADPPTTAGWAIPDLTQAEKDDLMAALAERKGTTDPRVTALTLRCGDLRKQRDEERRQWWLMRDERDEAKRQRDKAQLEAGVLAQERDRAREQRDEARAQAVKATTQADDLRARIADAIDQVSDSRGRADEDVEFIAMAVAGSGGPGLRARVEAVVATWPPGPRKGDVLRALEER